MDKVQRHQLKGDRFVEGFGHTVDYAAHHRKQLLQYGLAVLAAIAIVAGVMAYRSSVHAQREALLGQALQAENAQVGQPGTEFIKAYPTQAEKDKDVNKLFNEVVSKYPGSDEAMIALYYLGSQAADKGNLAEAEKDLKQVADGGRKEYAAMAKYTLARVYSAQGKSADAQNALRDLMNNPTTTVSKEQATISLAQLVAANNPDEARKLLEPLRNDKNAAVSRIAITELGQLTH